MSATRRSALPITLAVLLVASGVLVWRLHSRAWDLGTRSPVLSYDAAQYALAARELAEHGRLATSFALPVELARHPSPPWPLALVQPGLLVLETALFRTAAPWTGTGLGEPNLVTERREQLVLCVTLACFLAIGVILALVVIRVLERHVPWLSPSVRVLASGVVGLNFLLDPEAQHFASGGFTELPFTLGLIMALSALALDLATGRPLVFGLLLGFTGAFRGNMLWLSPILASGAALLDPPERRLRTFAVVMCGYFLPLLPWWIYKWRVFGSPAWDLSWLSLWDGVGGRSWFSLNHLPEMPALPRGLPAITAIAGKVATNLPKLLIALGTGPRALWMGALLIWALATHPARPLKVASLAALGVLLVSVVVATASVPLLRYLFPMRIAVESAGILAVWGLLASAPQAMLAPRIKRGLGIAAAVLALGWGGWRMARGLEEARAAAAARGEPSSSSMHDLAAWLDRQIPASQPVMSNLGPILGWYAGRNVVHLSLTPADIDACRRHVEFHHVLLVFRDPQRAWPGWIELMERPSEATRNPEWNISRAERFQTRDGFLVVWLDLGPLAPKLARSGASIDRD